MGQVLVSEAARSPALHVASDGSWFTLEPSITASVVGATALYLFAIKRLRRGPTERVERRQVIMFLLAMFIIFVSLQGPLHVLSDNYLLSAHMLQHLLITLIMPPLLLKGIPGWLLDRLFFAPLFARRSLRRRGSSRLVALLPRGPMLTRIARFITSPFIAFGLFNVIFVIWHVPAFYDATLSNATAHAIMHTMFIGAAILTWWPVFSPTRQLPPLSDPLQMIYLFFQSIPSTVLGAIISLADIILYPTYGAASRVSAFFTPRVDQQMAGFMMWFGGAGFILFLITIRWFRWMEDDSDESFDVAQA